MAIVRVAWSLLRSVRGRVASRTGGSRGTEHSAQCAGKGRDAALIDARRVSLLCCVRGKGPGKEARAGRPREHSAQLRGKKQGAGALSGLPPSLPRSVGGRNLRWAES